MSKTPTLEEKRHMGRVQQLGCIVCAGPASVHHAGTGAGGRRDHMKVLPLCYYHHQGEQGIHTLGRKRWGAVYGTEDELLAKVDAALGMP